ncbi:MAG: hypothetical protein GY702_13390 [Desulfobulbaceae bacterium]|nr:hypothetical protein [Desulfobulbaceae bacterium]
MEFIGTTLQNQTLAAPVVFKSNKRLGGGCSQTNFGSSYFGFILTANLPSYQKYSVIAMTSFL